MSESLWNDIDARLKSELIAYMGKEGNFTTLVLQDVEASILTDPQAWVKRELPIAIIDGRTFDSSIEEHGDLWGNNFTARFRYFIACITRGSREEATRDAKILANRLRLFVQQQSNTIQTVTDDSGSHPERIIPGNRNIVSIYPIVGANNEYYGYAMRAFDIIAHMEQ